MTKRMIALMFAAAFSVSAADARGWTFEPQSSPQMEKAKDYIADEQWLRAIEMLRTASANTKERNRDEALFWLAHSQHQARDLAGAVETIAQLERTFPKSRWVKPARSLRVELAQKLRRSDVLWWTATAPAPPVPPAPPTMVTPPPHEAPRPLPPGTPRAVAPRPPRARGVQPPMPTPAPTPTHTFPSVWVAQSFVPDPGLRIQALGGLMQTDAPRVIPILREIALESANLHEARSALFILAQSGRPDAHLTVLEVAKRATEPVSVAAVRELGRFGGPKVADNLLEVYGAGKMRVKYQVVNALGERAATSHLLRIAQSEVDPPLRDTAIVTLGQAGGRVQLHQLYQRGRIELKRPIVIGLFNARAEDELIQIAEREKDPDLRREVLSLLRLLGTPKAKQYVEKAQGSR